MKLEVGMYVRTKDKNNVQFIRKIVEVSEGYRKMIAGLFVDKPIHNTNEVSLKNVVKASYNILDLIEVGDYVNGDMITDFEEDGKKIILGNEEQYYGIYPAQIESIATKEHFESIIYKV